LFYKYTINIPINKNPPKLFKESGVLYDLFLRLKIGEKKVLSFNKMTFEYLKFEMETITLSLSIIIQACISRVDT
jgi:hypothetical protein